ncbi:MAG TPA: hypothetical protein H9902_14245 [Candidatus Stackebrandtia faecavium]|nr:hypothetical protein [Candidatus Stackebrandtia faecavium]
MKLHSRRLYPAVVGAAMAISTLSACGAVTDAADCVSVVPTMEEVATNLTGDQETLQKSTDQLRKEAEDISNAKTKESAMEIADQAETINAGINGDVAEGAQTDQAKVRDAIDSFIDECNQFN